MKPKPKRKSVYRSQNATLRALFERAGDPRKVICVPLDYAKRKHVALVCDGHGDILKAAFPVENNPAGVAWLIEQISATARHRKIPKNQIFLGGEDEPAYVANFTVALREAGYLVMRVNAHEAKDNRENHAASTDHTALLGIAKTLLSRRARSSGDASPANPAYHHLRELARCRRSLVRQQTATANRIHALVDQLFPGFLDDSKTGLSAFCEASIELMKERFSAPEIAKRKPAALAKTLRRLLVHHPDEAAAKIITLARSALPPAPHRVATLQRTLTATVDLHQCLSRNAGELRTDAALTLATTPYALLTSIRGIGFVLAAGVAGELGDPATLGTTDSLCCLRRHRPQNPPNRRPRFPTRAGPRLPPVQPHPQGLGRSKRPENPPLRRARTQGSHHPLERRRPQRPLRRRAPLPAPAPLAGQKPGPLSRPGRTHPRCRSRGTCRCRARHLESDAEQMAHHTRRARSHVGRSPSPRVLAPRDQGSP